LKNESKQGLNKEFQHMRSTFVGALAFFTIPSLLSLLFIVASLQHRPLNNGTTTLDAFILPAYLMLITMIGATVGFVIVTAAAPVWRHLTPKRAALIAGPLGLICPVAYLLGLATTGVLVSRLHLSTWLSSLLVFIVPGVLLGLVAIPIAAFVKWRSAKNG
jgi:hypothetical protein